MRIEDVRLQFQTTEDYTSTLLNEIHNVYKGDPPEAIQTLIGPLYQIGK